MADNDVVFVGPTKFNLRLQAAALTQSIVVEADGIRNRELVQCLRNSSGQMPRHYQEC